MGNTRLRNPLTAALIVTAAAAVAASPASARAFDRRTPIVEAVEKVLPAVVNIGTTKSVRVTRNPFPFRFHSPLFDFPFGDMFEETYKMEGLGSGVAVEGGFVITNNHVIDYDFGPADKILVTAYGGGATREAVIVGANPVEDVAILRVEGEPLDKILPWGRSSDLMIGETVIAIGNALGQPFTVTDGIISALGRIIEDENGNRLSNLIQTNADINRGNSGGPLVNINGEFIGLNTAILSPSGGSVGLGFAIPVSRVRTIFDYWVNGILSLDDQLGIRAQDMTPRLELFFREEFPSLVDADLRGVVVTGVTPGGLADGRLNRMDIVNRVNGEPVRSMDDFSAALENARGGEISFGIIRGGRPAETRAEAGVQRVETLSWRGMALQEIDNHWRNRFGLDPQHAGVVVREVFENGAAAAAGIRAGDIVGKIAAGRTVYEPRTLEDIEALSRAAGAGNPVIAELLRRRATYGRDGARWQLVRTELEGGKSL